MFVQVVIIGLVRKNGKYLLTKRQDADSNSYGHGKWQFPGGGLEFGETTEECLYREMKEEIGADVQIRALVPQIFSDVRTKWQGVFVTYLTEMINPNDPIIINQESSEYGWFTLAEIKQLDRLKGTYLVAELAEKL